MLTGTIRLLTSVRCGVAVRPPSRWSVRTFQCPPVVVSGPLCNELSAKTVYPTSPYTTQEHHHNIQKLLTLQTRSTKLLFLSFYFKLLNFYLLTHYSLYIYFIFNSENTVHSEDHFEMHLIARHPELANQ